jgi:hypothetical protein
MCFPTTPRSTAGFLVASLLGGYACIPLPIPHNEQVTPSVAGTLRSDAGSPIAGAAIALTGSSRDTLCAHPAIRRVVDERGRFETPATEERKTIFWFTLMENFGLTDYWLCTGTVDSAGTALYLARTIIHGHAHGHAAGDSLVCLGWVWEERRRVTCNGTFPQRMFEGGHWARGAAHGWYRLIVADDEVWGYLSRAFVQWLEAKGPEAADSLVAMVELPDEVTSELRGVPFREQDSHWYLSIPSTKRTFWGHTRWLTFELGPPGEAHRVPEP